MKGIRSQRNFDDPFYNICTKSLRILILYTIAHNVNTHCFLVATQRFMGVRNRICEPWKNCGGIAGFR
jgi:hypothetical protein